METVRLDRSVVKPHNHKQLRRSEGGLWQPHWYPDLTHMRISTLENVKSNNLRPKMLRWDSVSSSWFGLRDYLFFIYSIQQPIHS
jgi:hypothetical protein